MATLKPSQLPPLLDAAVALNLCQFAQVHAECWHRTRGLLGSTCLAWVAIRLTGLRYPPNTYRMADGKARNVGGQDATDQWLLYASGKAGANWLRWRNVGPAALRRELAVWLAYRHPWEWAASEQVMLAAIEKSATPA